MGSKLLGLFALVYLVFPFDLLPDVVPVVGWIDDLGLSALAFVLLARAWQRYRGTPPSPEAQAPVEVVETIGSDVPERGRK